MKSFKLADGEAGDGGLTMGLMILALILSCIDVWISLGLTFHINTFIVFLITRFAFRRHYLKRIAAIEIECASNDEATT